MNSTYQYLISVRDAVSGTGVFESCKVGIERGIGTKDTPFARVVVVNKRPSDSGTDINFQVVFGFDSKNKDYEELHNMFFDAEEKIISALKPLGCFWIDTVTDGDTVQNLKTAVIEFKGELCM